MSNEDGSRPAFPATMYETGLSQRAYAAIHLRVTDPALPEWLNAMIERARRDEFAKAALQAIISKSPYMDSGDLSMVERITGGAHDYADAMLAQGRKG